MTRDLLREAARAVRRATASTPARTLETRARVVLTLRERRKRRLELMKILVPLAAVLVASTAWAATTGKLCHVVRFLSFADGRAAEAEPAPAMATATTTGSAREPRPTRDSTP